MVNYNCQRCGYKTNRKSAFKSHLLRKNLCKPILNELTRYTLLKSYGFDEEAKKHDNILEISSLTSSKKSSIHEDNSLDENKADNNICKYCSKKLSNYKNKWRHEKKCKHQNKQNDIEILKTLLEEKDKLINDLLMEIKNDKNENKKLMKQLIKLSNKTTNNLSNNNINSHNKIIINAYGSENIEYITEKVLKKLVNRPGSAIPNLLKMIHFNDNYPENKNLKVTNIHDPYIKVHDGDEWKLKNKGDIIEDIIITKRDILDGAITNEESDEIYLEKLERLDNVIDDKKNNYIESKIKEVLLNEGKDINV